MSALRKRAEEVAVSLWDEPEGPSPEDVAAVIEREARAFAENALRRVLEPLAHDSASSLSASYSVGVAVSALIAAAEKED